MRNLSTAGERRIAELVLRAGALATGEREGFLRAATGEDPKILAEVRRRLASAADLSNSFLAEPLGNVFELSVPAPEPAATLTPGTLIGNYRLESVLGRGGMGEVYQARDRVHDRSVAIKHIRSEAAGDPDRRERFWREARALAELGHPAIVRILDFLEVDSDEWIVMERVDGQTLAELLREGPLDPDRVLDVGTQVASALAAAHAQGIVHRDLKTENVMVPSGNGASSSVKVLDFGLVRRVPLAARETRHTRAADDPTLSAAGQILGTPRAMSPEQARGHPLDARSDLFSLGVLLYEALTGHSPFAAGSLHQILERVVGHHPPPVRRLNPRVSKRLSDLVAQLLEKSPERRGDGAGAVARALAELSTGEASPIPPPAADSEKRPGILRVWPPPELPELPYPVLLPYTHPALLAGRDDEIRELRDRLRMRPPILGLHGPSGIGKSSLLIGGLVPSLRAEGQPVAVVRHPREPGIARRLIADLLADDGREPPADDDEHGFRSRLLRVERLAAQPAVLVVDQLEEVLKPGDESSALRDLLAATVAPEVGEPPCRWLLAYRQEFHGAVEVWLHEVLQGRHAELFHDLPLAPLATPTGSLSGEASLTDATRTFQEAIERPLALRHDDGARRYPIRFEPGHAEQLARAFAEARRDRPEAPLVPELQVVLAHLVTQARTAGATPESTSVVELPEDTDNLISEALEGHLRRALKAAFPDRLADDVEARTRRARTLLALGELAARGERGLRPEALARAIGKNGKEVLEQLATPLTRLVVLRQRGDGFRYVLSHDRMADTVARLVEEEGRRGELLVDAELLALRRFVALETALHRSREKQATRIPRGHFRRIAANAEALLWDDERRAWWRSCQTRRRSDRRRAMIITTVAAIFLALVTWGSWNLARERREHQALLEQVVEGEPETALRALDRLATRPDANPDELRALLARRQVPMDVLERGMGGVSDGERSSVVLRAAELALPWVREAPENRALIANLVWALDYAPGREAPFVARARALRERVLEPLRQLRPPPPLPEPGDPDWIDVPAGTFVMGMEPMTPGGDHRWPRHQVTVSAFRIQRHEVTNAEYRRLVPDHAGDDDLPAIFYTWYAAYVYAAWLGGRLPTEAEWEYAAGAGCRHSFCGQDGREVSVDDVAWTLRNSRDAATDSMAPRPVMQLESNPWGLYDMLGNVWEWTADWHGETSSDSRRDPWGRPSDSGSGWRVVRGGSFWAGAEAAQVAIRYGYAPEVVNDLGFRAILPIVPKSH